MERVRITKLLITIIKREFEDAYIELFQKNGVHILFGSLCSGTAQQKALDYLGIEKERTRVEWVSAAEGAKFAATMNDFAKTITELGENKKLEDLRCKKSLD